MISDSFFYTPAPFSREDKENLTKKIAGLGEEEETHQIHMMLTPNTAKRQCNKNADRDFIQNAATNSIQINVKKRMVLSPEETILSCSKTPLQERKGAKNRGSPRKRSFMEVDSHSELLLYAPMKGLKLREDAYKTEKIRLFDGTRNKNPIHFRVFQDSTLGISKSKQKKIHFATIDDDCQTDSEQIKLAIQHSKKELADALKTNRNGLLCFSDEEESFSVSESSSPQFLSLLSQSTESMDDVPKRLSFDDC